MSIRACRKDGVKTVFKYHLTTVDTDIDKSACIVSKIEERGGQAVGNTEHAIVEIDVDIDDIGGSRSGFIIEIGCAENALGKSFKGVILKGELGMFFVC